MIGRGGGAIDVHVMVLNHQHHDERSADRIKDRFKREDRQPGAAMSVRQEHAHRQRYQEDAGMQARHHDRGGARIARPGPLTPQLHRNEEGVDGDDQRTDNFAIAAVQHARNLGETQPQRSADESCKRQHATAMDSRTPFQTMPQARNVNAPGSAAGSLMNGAGIVPAIADAPIR